MSAYMYVCMHVYVCVHIRRRKRNIILSYIILYSSFLCCVISYYIPFYCILIVCASQVCPMMLHSISFAFAQHILWKQVERLQGRWWKRAWNELPCLWNHEPVNRSGSISNAAKLKQADRTNGIPHLDTERGLKRTGFPHACMYQYLCI